MALTNAERQAAFKARRAETMDALAQQNAALLAEVAELRAELDALKEKAHRLEVAALKAQLEGGAAGEGRSSEKASREKGRQAWVMAAWSPAIPREAGPLCGRSSGAWPGPS